MEPAVRVVLDTNVLLSLFVFADSRFAPLRRRLVDGAWLALTRADCLDEFRRVLAYPEFALNVAAQAAAYAAYGELVRPIVADSVLRAVLPRCRDADDQKFLEVARDGGAELLITADKALLKLARRDRLRGLFRIITPDAALAEPFAGMPARSSGCN